ncbi:MAG: TolC family protein, partial [Verrucomicrobiota bacterium]
VDEVIEATRAENLAMIAESVGYIAERGRELVYDAEHFFDGYEADSAYALDTLRAARDAGASTLVLCDTNGGTLTNRMSEIVRAARHRPDYRQALLDIQKRQITVVFTRNQGLPRLDLTASFGVNGIDTSLAGSFQRTSGQANNNFAWNAGAIFSVPFPNNAGLGNLEVSKLEALRSLVDLKRLEQAILVEADNAAGQIDTARKLTEATRAAREYAQLTLAGAQTRLSSGTITTFEVLQFLRDLATAEANEYRARADFIKAVAFYARLTGSTLERNRVILE